MDFANDSSNLYNIEYQIGPTDCTAKSIYIDNQSELTLLLFKKNN